MMDSICLWVLPELENFVLVNCMQPRKIKIFKVWTGLN
jgi:hypothetical protein